MCRSLDVHLLLTNSLGLALAIKIAVLARVLQTLIDMLLALIAYVIRLYVDVVHV